MKLVFSLLIVIIFLLWPKLNRLHPFILLLAGALLLLFGFAFTSMLLIFSPLLYLGAAILLILLVYKGIT